MCSLILAASMTTVQPPNREEIQYKSPEQMGLIQPLDARRETRDTTPDRKPIVTLPFPWIFPRLMFI